jgi:hypothetical protein
MHITGQLFECKHLGVINAILEKVTLNSLKEIVLGLPLNFSILLEELLTSMVYMGVEVTACNKIYNDGVKSGAVTGVPH